MHAGLPLCAAFAALSTGALASKPCDDIDRGLSAERARQLSLRAAKQFHDPEAKAVQSFAYDGWHIVYVEFSVSDPAFIFYHGDPLSRPYITAWGGASDIDEMSQIKEWTVENAPGIPNQLARCFAWHVSVDRERQTSSSVKR